MSSPSAKRAHQRLLQYRRAGVLAHVVGMLNAGKDLHEILKVTAEGMIFALFGDDAVVCFLTADNKSFKAMQEVKPLNRKGTEYRVEDYPHTQASLTTGKAMFLTRENAASHELARLKRLNFVSTIIIPLSVHNTRIGVMYVSNHEGTRKRPPTPEELGFAELIGAQCAIAIDRCRAVENLQQEIQLRERLMSILSHDLRQPMSTLRMLFEVESRKAAHQAPEVMKKWQRIVRSIDRMDDLISDILDYSRLRSGRALAFQRRPCDLEAVIRAEVDSLPDKTRTHQLYLTLQGDLRGEWDEKRLGQIISNLLSNALKYGEYNGPIHVRAAGLDQHVVQITVHNFGKPIPPEAQERIFEPFQQVRDQHSASQSGLGLGLYIVRESARLHGGEVIVHSTEKDGTTFVVTLPRVAGESCKETTGQLPLPF